VCLALFEAIVTIGLFAFESKTAAWFATLDEESSGAQIKKLRDAVNENPLAWKMVGSAALLCFFLSIGAGSLLCGV
jgi:hypothetical protein